MLQTLGRNLLLLIAQVFEPVVLLKERVDLWIGDQLTMLHVPVGQHATIITVGWVVLAVLLLLALRGWLRLLLAVLLVLMAMKLSGLLTPT